MRAVDFSRSQKSRDNADQHRRQENIPLGILDLFRQGGDAVESDVGKHRDRCSVKHSIDRESLRVVERTQKVRFRILRQMKNVADRIPEESQNHRSHDGAQGLD